MANLVVIQDLSSFPLTRQDLYDMWTTAQLGSVVASDLETGFLSVQSVTSFSDLPSAPQSGQLAWSQIEQLMYCFHDEIDNTGVSLWLAIGPDTFETAALLSGPAFPGSALEATYDRWVRPAPTTEPYLGDGVSHRLMGTLHSGVPYPLNIETPNTAASGTWVRAGIDGYVFGWIPVASGISTALYSVQASTGVALSDRAAFPGALRKSQAAGGRHIDPGFCGDMYYTAFNNTTPSDWGMHFKFIWFGGYMDQRDT